MSDILQFVIPSLPLSLPFPPHLHLPSFLFSSLLSPPFRSPSSSLLPLSFLQSKTGHPLCSFENNNEYVYDVQWSPIHPALFASVDGEGRLDFWNINVDTEVHATQSVVRVRVRGTQSVKEDAASKDQGMAFLALADVFVHSSAPPSLFLPSSIPYGSLPLPRSHSFFFFSLFSILPSSSSHLSSLTSYFSHPLSFSPSLPPRYPYSPSS